MKIQDIINRIKSHPGSRVSLFRLGWQLIPYYFSRSGYSFSPLTIYIAVNSVCNMRCKMCDFGQQIKESLFYKNLKTEETTAELSLEVLKKMVDDVKNFKPLISINAAEPLLYKNIKEISKYIVDSGLEMQITTNGYFLENFAEAFVEIGIQKIWISLDGPAEIHNQIRGVDDCFERATRGIRKIESIKREKGALYPEIHIAFTISNYNYHSLEAHLRNISDIDFKSMVFAHLNFITPKLAEKHNREAGKICQATAMSSAQIDIQEIDLTILHEQIQKLKKHKDKKIYFLPKLNYQELEIFYRQPEAFIKTTKCQVPWVAVQVLANGNLVPLSRCYNFDLGNINENSFLELWNGPKMKELRKNLQKYGSFPACSRCCGLF